MPEVGEEEGLCTVVSVAKPETGSSLALRERRRLALNLASMVNFMLRRSWLMEVSGPFVVLNRTWEGLTQVDSSDRMSVSVTQATCQCM